MSMNSTLTKWIGFAQKRFMNGTFTYTDPVDCSMNDKNASRPCSLQSNNVVGFYESSSWEYSWYRTPYRYALSNIDLRQVCAT